MDAVTTRSCRCGPLCFAKARRALKLYIQLSGRVGVASFSSSGPPHGHLLAICFHMASLIVRGYEMNNQEGFVEM